MSSFSDLAVSLQKGYACAERDHQQELLNTLTANSGFQNLLRTNQLAKTILGLTDSMNAYNNPEWQEQAIEIIIASDVYSGVERREREQKEGKGDQNLGYTDFLVLELLHWFRHKFFKWVNKPDCDRCGNADQDQIEPAGNAPPATREEIQGRAAGVEIYKCKKCQEQIRFPRLNNPSSLLKSRRGRCGEWNNCFLLLLKSLDIKCRSVWNSEDHVWSEFYSESLQRWVHLDSCEDAFDNPHLYNRGWAKKMSYVFGFGEDYAIDLSEKYICKDLDRALPRNKIDESSLSTVFRYVNAKRWASETDDTGLYKKLVQYNLEINALTRTSSANSFAKNQEKSQTEMKPRESGSAEWTKNRGEDGR
ncbi:unnamed protein product [Kuraishia capsulata CBS 1993]|uniref:Peptide:N-glycanase 1 n=1 Tax=Kuraishia capsulata CBS 1993 TaxID=1382522 RepID=W6MSA3_9ASCO|nr:uncharacterized protein KUCA_T00005567001 [Kuraishia capsulata CBS 1993]CDK29574.1 unnamed protein product [Kuraishia capsulata CBS 1993]